MNLQDSRQNIDSGEIFEVDYEHRAKYYAYEYTETVDHQFFGQLINNKVNSILEVPCGAGRNAFILAESGREVTAVDIEPFMIDFLSKRLSKANISNVIPIVSDMCDLNLNQHFDLILVPREAFQLLPTFDHAERALTSMKRHLSQNGRIMIDLYHFGFDDSDDPSVHPVYFHPDGPMGEFIYDCAIPLSNGTILHRYRNQIVNDSYAAIQFIYHLESEDKVRQKWKTRIELKLYKKNEFEVIVNKVGLKIDAIYRDYKFTPFENDSSRMIFILSH